MAWSWSLHVAARHSACSVPSYTWERIPSHSPGKNQGHYRTLKQMENCFNTGRIVITENWYTSLPLAQDLLDNGWNLVGTIRDKPYIPEEMLELQRERPVGSTAFLFGDKIVSLLSTVHPKPQFGEREKSTALLYYNKHKGGVATFDQLCSYYTCSWRTRRWPLCVLFWMRTSSILPRTRKEMANRWQGWLSWKSWARNSSNRGLSTAWLCLASILLSKGSSKKCLVTATSIQHMCKSHRQLVDVDLAQDPGTERQERGVKGVRSLPAENTWPVPLCLECCELK